MKSSKNFQKAKKTRSFDGDGESRIKKLDSSKKSKYFKKEIEDELDEDEELDLFGFKDEIDESDDD